MDNPRTPTATALLGAVGLLSCILALGAAPAERSPDEPRRATARTGEAIYTEACASCHGVDGTGGDPALVRFETPLPDFTDCSFATREPDVDWLAVAHQGGPARGFARMMPAFDEALTDGEIQAAVDHLRTFCDDDGWPRGELNFPRPMFIEKAYPEDEAVYTVGVKTEEPRAVYHELTYEKRFGDRYQFEAVVPFTIHDQGSGDGWKGGLEDVALGIKAALLHSLRTGSILSLTGEVVLPTGDEDDGFGGGTTVFEPFLSYGQSLAAAGFVQLQGGAGLSVDPDHKDHEAFWRGLYGRSFRQGRFGRTWTPMVGVLGARDLADGAQTHWDLVPQLQVTLNTRQNIMANAAVRIPVNDADARSVEVYFYVLWDWFDGGLTEGW
ncbi:MAG: c-type cytochrome [Myxococcota bacterium]